MGSVQRPGVYTVYLRNYTYYDVFTRIIRVIKKMVIFCLMLDVYYKDNLQIFS